MIRVLAGLALVGCLAPSVAEACGGLPHCVPFSAPLSDGGIPANAPAIVLGSRLAPPLTPEHVTLLNEAGEAVAFTLEREGTTDRYLLRAALEENSGYTARFADTCQAPDAGQAQPSFEVPFHTGAAAEVPSTFGAVALTSSGVALVDVPTQCGSCSVQRAAAFARFQLSPSAEALPWLPLTRFTLRVDGQVWRTSDFGSGASEARTGGSLLEGRSFDDVYAVCRRGTEVVFDDGLTEGTHQLEWTAQIAGRGEIPMGSAQLTLSCDGAEALPPQGDSCFSSPQGDDGGVDAGVGGGPRPSGGCFGGVPAVIALVLAGALIRRRRGPAPAGSPPTGR